MTIELKYWQRHSLADRVQASYQRVRWATRTDQAAGLGRVYDVYAFCVEEAQQHRIAVLFRDSTEQKRAAAALRDSEARFRVLTESLAAVGVALSARRPVRLSEPPTTTAARPPS